MSDFLCARGITHTQNGIGVNELRRQASPPLPPSVVAAREIDISAIVLFAMFGDRFTRMHGARLRSIFDLRRSHRWTTFRTNYIWFKSMPLLCHRYCRSIYTYTFLSFDAGWMKIAQWRTTHVGGLDPRRMGDGRSLSFRGQYHSRYSCAENQFGRARTAQSINIETVRCECDSIGSRLNRHPSLNTHF